MKLAVDAMGGDFAPQAVLEGLALVWPELDAATEIRLYGDDAALREGLRKHGLDAERRITVVPTSEVVGCDEAPTLAIRKKKDSSLVRAVTDVAEGRADCLLSAGSTGALLTGATLIIRRQPGVKRPALATLLPTKAADGRVLLLDSGANTDCKPAYLVQFALMGSAYMERAAGVKSPRVGLLNNGAEEGKGSELTKAAHALLKTAPLNFQGNCEARDALSGDFDVVVADGFDGNVLLKGLEGAASLIMDMLKDGLTGSLRGRLGAALAMPALRGVKRKMDYTEYGGAPLLGVRGGVVKAHGSSNARAFRSAMLQCARLTASGVTQSLAEAVASMALED
ncbi:MAG: phosphate acyltransferase PlsX [Clostridia bacterium]|nr:phosphate acyltransferase PlsX [Clostridia bacterium]